MTLAPPALPPARLLERLRERGVELRVEAGQLRFRAPAGALDADLRAQVVEAKPALVALLSRTAEARATHLPPLRPAADARAEWPLSAAQRRFWFLDQATPGNPTFNLPYVLRLTGDLDVGALRAAIGAVVDRHASLRTTFPDRAGEPVQRIGAPGGPAPDLPVVDLAGAEEADDQLVRAHIDAEFRTGFDLVAGPLIRTGLLRTAAHEHLLLLTVHHIVFDGWSYAIFLEDLAAAYRAIRAGRPAGTPPDALQYPDYAAWQQTWLDGPVTAAGLEAWRRELGPAPSPLDLPGDRPRPPRQTYAGAALPVTLPAELTAAVGRLAREEGATPFMVLLTAYAVLLGRLGGQPDLVVGTPVAGRPVAELERMVGFFVNMLPLRTNLGGAPTFREAVRRVRATTLDAYDNQLVPFERLVEEFAGDRDLSRPPLFSAMFALQTMPTARVDLPGLEVTPVFGPQGVAKYDVSLVLQPTGDRLEGALEYSTDRFDAGTAARFVAMFRTVLAAALGAPDTLVADLPLVDDAERRRLVADENATAAPVPDRRLPELLADAAARYPSAVAVEAADATLTYSALHARADALAARLHGLGVGPGHVVAVLGERSAATVVALLGVLRSGAAYLPLDPAYPAERLAFLLHDSGAAVVVTCGDAEPPAGWTGTVLEGDAVPATAGAVDLPRPGPEDVAYVIHTSGSTGRPKGVRIPHRAIVNFLTSMTREPGLGAGDTVLSVISFSFDFSVLELFLPLTTGARLVLATREEVGDGRRLADRLAGCGATWMSATPTTWRLLLEAGWRGRPGLVAGSGGEALSPDLARDLLPRVGALWNLYGPTETTVFSAVDRVTDPDRITIGRPIANTQIHVLDPRGRPQPVGVPGEIGIGGAGVALGYHARPELTAERFVPDGLGPGGGPLYRTGDIGRRLADGRVVCLGRVDDQVKLRGHRIETGEVASVLEEHPRVRQAVVVVRPDRAGDPQLTAYVTGPDEGAGEVADVREHARRLLPAHLVPTVWVTLPRIPLMPNGKVDRAALPAPGEPSRGAVTEPATATERRVAAAWRAVLGPVALDRDDDFFAVGGESMKAVRVVRALAEDVPVLELFAHPTIRTLAAYLDRPRENRQHGDGGERALVVPLRTPPARARKLFVCFPFGGGGAVSFEPLARCAPADWDVRAVELPGHDPARRDEPLLPLEVVAGRCAREIAAAAGDAAIVLYGHCVGSALAVAVTRELERAGHRVAGVIAGASFPSAALPGRLGRLAALSPGRRQNSRAVQDSLRVLGGLGGTLPAEERKLLARNLRHDAHEAERWFAGAGDRRVDAPLLAIAGGADKLTEFAAERVEDWRAVSGDVRLAVIPGAEHFFQRECPTAVMRLVVDWLDGHAVGAAVEPAAVPTAERLRGFLLVVLGQLVSLIGTGLTTFALGVWAYQRTGSVTAFAGIATVGLVPAVLVAPLAGAAADRIDRRRVMLACDTVGLLTAAALLALVFGGGLRLWQLYVIAGVGATAGAFRQPAYLAGATQLVPKRYLGSAAGLLQLGAASSTIVSQLLGGLVLTLIGLRGAAVVDGLTFAAALLSLLAVRFPDALFARRPEPLGREIAEGARFLLRRPPLLALTLFFTVANALGGVLVVLVTPLLLAVSGPASLGVVLGAQGVGMLAGSVLMALWGGARRRSSGMLLAVAVFGVSTLLIGLFPTPGPAALGMAGVGVCAALANAHWLALVQVKVPVTMQGRVISSCLMLARTAMPAAYLAAGPLVAAAGGSTRATAAVVVGTGLVALVLTASGFLFRPLRAADDLLPDALLAVP